jgi:DNA-binding NtrC family response regulator
LVVDDEVAVLHIARLALERVGHQVVTAESGDEAFRKAALMECVDVLIVDHKMPADRGCDLAASLSRLHPAMKVMHMSGWHRDQVEAAGSLMPGSTMLEKPFTVQQLRNAVTALLA